MKDLSQLSDDELMQLKAQKQFESNRSMSLKDLSDDELLALKKVKETKSNDRPIEAFATGLGNATTFGYGPQVGAAIGPAVDKGIELFTGLKVPESTYEERVAENVAQKKGLQESNPYMSMGGEVAGTVGGAFGLGRALQGLKVLKPAGVIARGAGPATRMGTLGTKVGNAAKEGIAYGALANPNPENKEITGNQELAQRIENAGTAGAISGAFPVAGQVLKSTGSGLAAAPKKALTMLGVSEENINKYLSRNKQINSAPSLEDFKSKVDGLVTQILDDVESKKLSVVEAKALFKEAQSQVKQSKIGALDDAKILLRDAEKRLNQVFEATKAGLKNTPAPTHLAPEITQSVKKLQERVTKGSSEAFDILEQEGKPVEITEIPQNIMKIANEFKVGGKFATSKSEASYNFLLGQAQRLFELPSRLSGRDAKKILKQLDDEITWARNTGQYTATESRALQSARAAIDEVLKKQSPAYAAKMQQVAKDVQLLNRASDAFGDSYSLPAKLSGIGGKGREVDRKILGEVSESMGVDLKSPIDDFMITQARAGDKAYLDGVKNSLPEMQDVNKARVGLSAAEEAASPQTINRAGFESKEFQKIEEAKAAYDAAKASQKKNLPGVTTQTTQKLIKNVINDNSIESVKKLEFLSKLADEDLVQIANDIGTRSAFQKTAFNGSRNVNLFGILFQAAAKPAIGATIGGLYEGGLEGAAMGAVTGAMVDRYGPRATKQILDVVIRAKGSPTASMIQNTTLPPMLKRELVELLPSIRRGATSTGVEAAEGLSKVAEKDDAMKRRLRKAD